MWPEHPAIFIDQFLWTHLHVVQSLNFIIGLSNFGLE